MIKNVQTKWQKFEYKHTSVTIFIIILTVLFLNTALSTAVLEWFQNLGLLGGFIGGILSVSMFTTVPAVVLLVSVAQLTNPIILIAVASIGSVIGDWLIIKFLEDEVATELKPILRKYHILPAIRRFQRSKAKWIATALGTAAIALPLPDEIGIALMDVSNVKRRHLLIICFVLNTIGLTAIIYSSRVLF